MTTQHFSTRVACDFDRFELKGDVVSLCSFSRAGLTLFVATLLSFTQLQLRAVRAADTIRESSSLKIVPADVEFYSSSLRNREQFDALVNSKAFARLMQMPVVQMGVGFLKQQWENSDDPDFQEFKEFLDEPDNKQLLEVLVDAISQEIFFYGDAGFADLVSVVTELSGVQRTAGLQALATGQDPGEIIAKRIMGLLQKHSAKLNIPTTVIGFKLTDTKRAQTQLSRLETLLTQILTKEPELKKRFRREQIGGSQFLTLRLDGTLVPWEEVRRELSELDEDQVDKLIALAKNEDADHQSGSARRLLAAVDRRQQQISAGLGQGQVVGRSKRAGPAAQVR